MQGSKQTPKLHCNALLDSNSNHLQQILTGFEQLHADGTIEFQQTFLCSSKRFKLNYNSPPSSHEGGLRIIINGKTKFFYDVHDSHDIDGDSLIWSDFYFKRSFNQDVHSKLSDKIKPLDLNYMVVSSLPNKFRLQRAWRFWKGSTAIKELIREIDTKNRLGYLPRQCTIEGRPDISAPFKVLFLCRLWEPCHDDVYELTKQQAKDREHINDMRVQCIRALRQQFGSDFVGGVADTPYARQSYPDVIFKDTHLTRKKNYIPFVKEFSVVVATTGLSGSIGWKFGEYVALSKAIVSEKLQSQTQGGINSGEHYLEFSTPEECISAVETLKNENIRQRMMVNNFDYYRNCLEPKQMISQSLKKIRNLT